MADNKIRALGSFIMTRDLKVLQLPKEKFFEFRQS